MDVCRYILVDYDNLSKNTHSSEKYLWTNIKYCVKKLAAETLFFDDLPNMSLVKVRLYGGWFDQSGNRTMQASNVVAAVAASPLQIVVLKDKPKLSIMLEMADGLLSMPKSPLYATYRVNSFDGLGLKPNAPFCGCKKGDEARSYLIDYFRSKICSACKLPIGEIFRHEGQKLVDSMMFCDAEWVAREEGGMAAIVSSDDDMIPILFQLSITHPNHVIRILTEKMESVSYRDFYAQIKPAGLTILKW